jgi:phosphate transport system permease protein
MPGIKNKLQTFFTYACMIITILILVMIVGYLVVKGVGYLDYDMFFAPPTTTEETGLMPLIVSSLIMIGGTLVVAAPVGICAAIYIQEYSRRGSKVMSVISVAVDTLAGIPSILYGLFGLLFFVKALGFSFSLIAGCLTLMIMVLPTIISATAEALSTVPDSYREASLGLGATRLGTTMRVVLPSALPGILASVILSIGRIVGESAAVMLTVGTMLKFPDSIFSSGRTLAVQMYILAKEGIGDFGNAFATALVLIVIVLIINFAASALLKGNKDNE